MNLNSIVHAPELKGKRVLLRVDFNVPFLDGRPDARGLSKLERSLATLKFLLSRGARVIVLTHLGRPKGQRDAKLSTRSLVPELSRQLSRKVAWSSGLVGVVEARRVKTLKNGEVLLLENTRFNSGEEKNSKELSKSLAHLADIYVNDAFASSHRAHATLVGVTEYLPSYAGLQLVEEVSTLLRVMERPEKPLVVIMGGAKISTKAKVIERFMRRGAKILVGGALANLFFKAQGLNVGRSLVEDDQLALAREILEIGEVILPSDVIVAESSNATSIRMVPMMAIRENEMALDIGVKTLLEFSQHIAKARTIVWNGPVGLIEAPSFVHGSLMLSRMIARQSELGAFSVVGGGDTLPVAAASGMAHTFNFLSTGGGAMLEFLSGIMLPGVAPLIIK